VNILKKEGQKKEKIFSIIKKQQISRFGILFFKLLIVKFEEKKKGKNHTINYRRLYLALVDGGVKRVPRSR